MSSIAMVSYGYLMTGLDLLQRTRKRKWVFKVIASKFLEDVKAVVILEKANLSNFVST
jgi:hypothetical protein